MARIAGVDIPNDKRVVIALTYIYGIGRPTAQKVLEEVNIDESIRVKDLSDEQIRSLIRMQLDKKAQWDICDFQMKGTNAMSKKCYSMWGKKLSIVEPDMDSVNEALGYIEVFMNGETAAVQNN